jgi:polysaccharide deacetylase 2 family uncharacterized protein YibQ
MIKDSKLKAKVKLYLLGSNIALGVILLSLVVYWLVSVRSTQIARATELGQYRTYSMTKLPFITDEIEADYVGLQKQVAKGLEEAEDIDLELASIDVPPKQDSLIDQTEQVLAKSEELLSSTTKAKDLPSKKKRTYSGKPKISIVVTNLGLNRRSTELALTLPPQCALGFLPYTQSLKPLFHKAQAKGHEIYLYLPLQTSKALDNPGKYALMNNLASEENEVRLNVILNSHLRYNGVYSSYKEVFTDNMPASEMLFDQLSDKNLIFILGKGLSKGAQAHIASRNNVIPTNIIIDKEPDKDSIRNQLEELIRVAKNEGIALGYAQGFTLTIEMIREWIPALNKQGVQLIPVSELLKEYNS